MTPLDRAYEAMEKAPDDDPHPRLRFYERLAAGELFLMLGQDDAPKVFDLKDGPVALVFDTEGRLADFTGGFANMAKLPGRLVVEQLAGRGVGLGVNLGASSAILLPPEAVDWLGGLLAERPKMDAGKPVELTQPKGIPERLVLALDQRLAAAEGLASHALLAGATYADGRRGYLLGLVDAADGAEEALARAVGEAVVFTGIDAGVLDVAFLGAEDPVVERMASVGLRFDLPVPVDPIQRRSGPPRLR